MAESEYPDDVTWEERPRRLFGPTRKNRFMWFALLAVTSTAAVALSLPKEIPKKEQTVAEKKPVVVPEKKQPKTACQRVHEASQRYGFAVGPATEAYCRKSI